jgi:hypothetical protein
MNKLIILLVLFITSPSVFAERWVAKCTDGNNLHYVQDYTGTGHLFMEVATPRGKKKILPIATLTQSKSTAVSICGIVLGNDDPVDAPVSQVCMNNDLQIIYMKFDHPSRDGGIQEGKICKAKVEIFNDE